MTDMLEELLTILYRPILTKLETLMATAADLQAKLDAVQQSLTDAQARITADFDNLKAQLGQLVDPTTLDALSTNLDSLKASIDSIDPDPNFPPAS